MAPRVSTGPIALTAGLVVGCSAADKATLRPEPSTVVVPSAEPAEPVEARTQVGCVLTLMVGRERAEVAGRGMTHAAACLAAWSEVEGERGVRLVAMDGRALYDFVPLAAPSAASDGDGTTSCEIVVQGRGPKVRGRGTSTVDHREAEAKARAELCKALGEPCGPDRYAVEGKSQSFSSVQGARSYEVVLTAYPLGEERTVRGRGADLVAACRRAWAGACAGDCSGVVLRRVEGVPLARDPVKARGLFPPR